MKINIEELRKRHPELICGWQNANLPYLDRPRTLEELEASKEQAHVSYKRCKWVLLFITFQLPIVSASLTAGFIFLYSKWEGLHFWAQLFFAFALVNGGVSFIADQSTKKRAQKAVDQYNYADGQLEAFKRDITYLAPVLDQSRSEGFLMESLKFEAIRERLIIRVERILSTKLDLILTCHTATDNDAPKVIAAGQAVLEAEEKFESLWRTIIVAFNYKGRIWKGELFEEARRRMVAKTQKPVLT